MDFTAQTFPKDIEVTINSKGWKVGDVLNCNLKGSPYVVIAVFEDMAVLSVINLFEPDISHHFEKVI